MRRLTHAPNIALASLWVDLLRQAGIDASVQRYFASSIAGDIPPDQAEPEIWIADDTQFDRAEVLLADMRRPTWRHWACPGCHEIIDGPFEQCWQCGAVMPA
jgi:Putative prokaryotic signal transducing protein